MIILLMGAPGAGKGTQADLISEKFGVAKLSTGDALRAQIRKGTEIGKNVEGVLAEGKLVSDDILLQILLSEFQDATLKDILLDGYPRNVAQAEELARFQEPYEVGIVIHLDVPEAELVKRLTGRMVCKSCGKSYHQIAMPIPSDGKCEQCQGADFFQRDDDKKDKVLVRLKTYEENTKPVLDYYRVQNLYRKVDGTGSANAIFKQVSAILTEIGVSVKDA